MRIRKLITLMLLAFALLALATGTLAQVNGPLAYDISWFSIDGGGGTSSGGTYTLNGTMGQPDAGSLSGGSYTLNGGFWAGGAPPLVKIFLPLVEK